MIGVGHVDFVCECCGVRLGGCRCPSPDKTRVQRGLCKSCEKTRAESRPLPAMVDFEPKQSDTAQLRERIRRLAQAVDGLPMGVVVTIKMMGEVEEQ